MNRACLTFAYESGYKWHLDHTAPGGQHRWGNWEFCFNEIAHACDAWIVWQSHDGLLQTETRLCPPNKTILVTREPPDIIELPPDYVKQFAIVLAPDARLKWHHGHVFSQFGQNWHIEKDYDELTVMSPPEKSKTLAAVISSKAGTRGHMQRLQLARAVKDAFEDQFDWYGRGVNPIQHKWDSVAPYQYHLTMENGQWPHYWTEKLADAFLGWCLPFYVGDPKILDYFDHRSLVVLNPDRPEECVKKIRRAISDNLWEKSLPYIADARQKILHEYHLYRVLHDLLERETPLPARETTLRPASEFGFPLMTRLGWRCRNMARRLRIAR